LTAELERIGNAASIKTETMVVKREVRDVVFRKQKFIQLGDKKTMDKLSKAFLNKLSYK